MSQDASLLDGAALLLGVSDNSNPSTNLTSSMASSSLSSTTPSTRKTRKSSQSMPNVSPPLAAADLPPEDDPPDKTQVEADPDLDGGDHEDPNVEPEEFVTGTPRVDEDGAGEDGAELDEAEEADEDDSDIPQSHSQPRPARSSKKKCLAKLARWGQPEDAVAGAARPVSKVTTAAKKDKRKKNPALPPTRRSAFFHFCAMKNWRAWAKSILLEANEHVVSMNISKVLSSVWQNLPASDKERVRQASLANEAFELPIPDNFEFDIYTSSKFQRPTPPSETSRVARIRKQPSSPPRSTSAGSDGSEEELSESPGRSRSRSQSPDKTARRAHAAQRRSRSRSASPDRPSRRRRVASAMPMDPMMMPYSAMGYHMMPYHPSMMGGHPQYMYHPMMNPGYSMPPTGMPYPSPYPSPYAMYGYPQPTSQPTTQSHAQLPPQHLPHHSQQSAHVQPQHIMSQHPQHPVQSSGQPLSAALSATPVVLNSNPTSPSNVNGSASASMQFPTSNGSVYGQGYFPMMPSSSVYHYGGGN
eukprot:TRINITY_DN3514_c0_g5_i4.p1 TRINITY_DN3514_c0_g5~~TRINITY_DN3514_c0_g5_i4.p1  ORF type:complete len:528 (+),score=52.56 TRINITY_DN3514_c0_g5_i4:106-1689(+)